MSTVDVRCVRPFRVRNAIFQRGDIAKLAAADAVLVLESGRGELADPTDIAELSRHVRSENAKHAKSSRRHPAAPGEDAGGPWRPLQP